jgi:RHS repeat-associated protein
VEEDYTVNDLNQITSRDVHPGLEIQGFSSPTNGVVTVNGTAATQVQEYFRHDLSVTNSSDAVWQAVSVQQVVGGVTNSLPTAPGFVAQDPEALVWDDDGNLLQDGRWNYRWNGENQMIEMSTRTNLPSSVPRVRLSFIYDWMGRRRYKEVHTSTNNFATTTWTKKHNFRYDGWHVVLEHQWNNGGATLTRWYARGRDLSETRDGAGGVGGMIRFATDEPGYGVHHHVAYDGNGNVSALVRGSNGSVASRYTYDPFGQTLTHAESTPAPNCPAGFSTKFTDAESGLIDYGFRVYASQHGGWRSRDDIGEQGGINLYQYLENLPTQGTEFLGREGWKIPKIGLAMFAAGVAEAALNLCQPGDRCLACCAAAGTAGLAAVNAAYAAEMAGCGALIIGAIPCVAWATADYALASWNLANDIDDCKKRCDTKRICFELLDLLTVS